MNMDEDANDGDHDADHERDAPRTPLKLVRPATSEAPSEREAAMVRLITYIVSGAALWNASTIATEQTLEKGGMVRVLIFGRYGIGLAVVHIWSTTRITVTADGGLSTILPGTYASVEDFIVKLGHAEDFVSHLPVPEREPNQSYAFFQDIYNERQRQEALREAGKFTWTCATEHPAATNDACARVLGEEYGEVCRALNDNEPVEKLRAELVQVAAVSVAWLERITL